MCGILGGNRENWNYEKAIKNLAHRGPDGQCVKKFNRLYLCFARLSIIDLSEHAMQPMITEDGRYAIVFNGEIYDFDKIRLELENKGYKFRTKSDTEVLLYAFEEWREKVMEHVDGIFAFAIFDIFDDKLYLFRDRCGVKPLYYYQSGIEFAFSSELKGITTLCSNVKFEVDNTALYDYHTYLYIPAPKTMYKNVYKLPPAHYLVYDLHNSKIKRISRYWKVKLNTNEGNPLSVNQLNEKAIELKHHISQAVKRQIVADVPVGTFLSGGVDSSIVTLSVRSFMENVTAYTVGFTDRRYDESVYANEMADIIGVKCKGKKFTDKDFSSLYRILIDLYDEPFADTSAYPTYLISKLAKEDVTVVLTGDGGDELFGGYDRCLYAKDTLDNNKLSNKTFSELALYCEDVFGINNHDIERILLEDVALLPSRYQYIKRPNRKYLRKKYNIPIDYDDFWFFRKYYHKELPAYTRMRYMDFMTYLDGDILTKVDRASMKVSLEARVPFLDKEVVEFAFSLTQEECNPSGALKGLLKYAFQDSIPRKKLERKKQGLSIPYKLIDYKTSPQEQIIHDLWHL